MSTGFRDTVGRRVREVWVEWAKRQPDPKPSWLVPYDELDEADKEADRCIGAALWGDGFAAALNAEPLLCENCGKPMSEHSPLAECWPAPAAERTGRRHQPERNVHMSKQMTYAATKRCPCGAGLAYDDTCVEEPFNVPSYWDCSAILLGTADQDVQHTARLPFSFYEIKSEGQPSANGATTRPADG